MKRRWIVEDQIGRGGMGVVFRARDPQTGERGALKRLAPTAASDLDLRARFERESRAAQAIQHPNVVRLLDWGEHQGGPCLVFELVDGGSLADRIRREGPLLWREAVGLAADVARGLHAIHTAGLIHRDVKPDNILLSKDAAKVADLGLVKRAPGLEQSRRLTQSGEVIGTPHYVAPEQILEQTVSAQTDLYGLGGTLYFALTGIPIFEGTVLTILKAQIEQVPVPPSRLRGGIPDPLERLVLRLLEKEPRKRGASAAAVARELEELVVEKKRAPGRLVVAGAALAGALVAFGAAVVILPAVKAPAVSDAPPAPPPAPNPPAPPAAPPPGATPSLKERLSALSPRIDELAGLPPDDARAHELADSLGKDIRGALGDLKRGDLAPEDRSLAEQCVCRFAELLSREESRPEESDVAWELSKVLDKNDPDEPPVLKLRVQVLFRRQRYQELLDLGKRMAKYPQLVSDSHALRAYAFASLGAGDAAEQELGLAQKLSDSGKETYRQTLSDLVACYQLCDESTRLTKAGKNMEALDLLTKAIRKREREGDAYLLRGAVRERLGDGDGAYQDYTRCYATRCLSAPDAICNRGHLDSKDPEKEIEDYNLALTLDPEYDTAYRNRAITRLKVRKDLDKALIDVDRAEKFGQGRSWLKDIPSLREEIKQAMQAR